MDYLFTLGCCFKTMTKLLSRLNLENQDEVYFVGDYIDRGLDSKTVLTYLIDNPFNQNLFPIKGNHEDLMLRAFTDKDDLFLWLRNGGDITLKSFGIDSIDDLMNFSTSSIDVNICDFLKGLPYYYDLGDTFIVHAGFNFNALDPFADYYSMMWIKEFQINNAIIGGKKIIHGHVPISIEKIKKSILDDHQVINIDGGCVYKNREGLGNLVAYNKDTHETLYQPNID